MDGRRKTWFNIVASGWISEFIFKLYYIKFKFEKSFLAIFVSD